MEVVLRMEEEFLHLQRSTLLSSPFFSSNSPLVLVNRHQLPRLVPCHAIALVDVCGVQGPDALALCCEELNTCILSDYKGQRSS